MPSLADSAFIFVLALLLFGPKKLPELARQLGKLMGEFRRASNEFRMQMDEELRLSEQAEQQKKIAAIEAAAPVAPLLDIPEPEHPHTPVYPPEPAAEPENRIQPIPIASNGDLHLMPPATGLPVSRNASSADTLGPILESIPQTPDPNLAQEVTRHEVTRQEVTTHG